MGLPRDSRDDSLAEAATWMQPDHEVALLARQSVVHNVARLEGHRRVERTSRLEQLRVKVEAEGGHVQGGGKGSGEVALAAADIDHAADPAQAAAPSADGGEKRGHLLGLLRALTPSARARALADGITTPPTERIGCGHHNVAQTAQVGRHAGCMTSRSAVQPKPLAFVRPLLVEREEPVHPSIVARPAIFACTAANQIRARAVAATRATSRRQRRRARRRQSRGSSHCS